MNPPRSIQVHIERLVVDEPLHSPGQSQVLQAAIEGELSRLLAETGLGVTEHFTVPMLAAESLKVPANGRPAPFGRQIARSIHAALGREGSAQANEPPPEPPARR